jgi:hypothetical protein
MATEAVGDRTFIVPLAPTTMLVYLAAPLN